MQFNHYHGSSMLAILLNCWFVYQKRLYWFVGISRDPNEGLWLVEVENVVRKNGQNFFENALIGTEKSAKIWERLKMATSRVQS